MTKAALESGRFILGQKIGATCRENHDLVPCFRLTCSNKEARRSVMGGKRSEEERRPVLALYPHANPGNN